MIWFDPEQTGARGQLGVGANVNIKAVFEPDGYRAHDITVNSASSAKRQ